MREIKFRGKVKGKNDWVFGSLLIYGDGEYNIHVPRKHNYKLDAWNVAPETVGQYTGLKDGKGNEIYEGDIIHLNDEEFELEHGNGIVVFLDTDLDGRPCGGMWYVEDADKNSSTNNALYDLWQCGHVEIIGNIHERKEDCYGLFGS